MGRGLAALLLAALASCLPCSTGQQPSSPGQPRLAGSEPVQPNSPESPAGPSNVWGVLMWGQAWLQHSYLLNGSMIVANRTLLPGIVVQPAEDNIQPSADACALSCRLARNCSVFNWCPPGGERCVVEALGPPMPPGGCSLRMQQMVVDSNGIAVLASGGSQATIAGAPLSVFNLTAPGYTSLPGLSMLGHSQVACPELSIRDDLCMLPGTEVADACTALKECWAFVYTPRGRDGLAVPAGVLKGASAQPGAAGLADASLRLSLANWNPDAILFVREGVILDTNGGSGGGGGADGAAQAALGQSWGILMAPQAQLLPLPDGGAFILARNAIVDSQRTVRGGGDNLRASPEACAASCKATEDCTGAPGLINYCPADAGQPCSLDPGDAPRLPPGGCALLSEKHAEAGNGVGLLTLRPDIRSMGGAPLLVPVNVSLPGFRAFPGRSWVGQYQLACRESMRHDSCRLLGSLEELHAACDARPDCQAITWNPLGRSGINGSMGTLKGVPGQPGAPLQLSRSNWNPAAVLLVREGANLVEEAAQAEDGPPPQPAGSSSLAAGTIAGVAIGGAAAAALLVGGGALLALRRERRRGHGGKRGLLPIAAKRTRSGADVPELNLIGADPSSILPDGSAAVVHSPVAAHVSAPRGRFPPSPPRPDLGTVQAPASPDTAAGERGDAASEPATPSSRQQSLPPSLEWAADLLSEHAQGWQEAVVQESDIQYLTGADGQPISLGAGAFGTVYKVLLQGHTPCAAKVVYWHGRQHNVLHFVQEACMLRRLRHPNIVQFVAVSVTEQRGILCMEFMPGRDLDACMNARSRANGTRLFDWYNRGRRVAADIASGLAFLHHCRVLHLDLKPHNVLLARDGTAKLGDVGFSRFMSRTHLSVEGRFGTWDWCAPEILLGRGATEKSDVWSLGVLLWEICSGTRPHRGQITPLRVPEQSPAEVAALVAACLAEDPEARPSAGEIVELLVKLPPSRRPPAPPPFPPAAPAPGQRVSPPAARSEAAAEAALPADAAAAAAGPPTPFARAEQQVAPPPAVPSPFASTEAQASRQASVPLQAPARSASSGPFSLSVPQYRGPPSPFASGAYAGPPAGAVLSLAISAQSAAASGGTQLPAVEATPAAAGSAAEGGSAASETRTP